MNTRSKSVGQPIRIEGMRFAPTNVAGVIFLFGRLAARLGFEIDAIDERTLVCVARERGEKRRIKFELHASDYERAPRKGVDLIVCWENDWGYRPKKHHRLDTLELKEFVGARPKVYCVGCNEFERGAALDRDEMTDWSVPQATRAGDLIVMYRTSPASEIRDLWVVKGPFGENNRFGKMAYMDRLVRLKKPLRFDELKNDRTTRDITVVRMQFQGKSDITADWPAICALILARNPQARRHLGDFVVD